MSSFVTDFLVPQELHQLSSPETAYGFLEELLDKSTAVEEAVTESRIFVDYIGKSWTGIIKSQGFM